jgi:carbonic anhydrase
MTRSIDALRVLSGVALALVLWTAPAMSAETARGAPAALAAEKAPSAPAAEKKQSPAAEKSNPTAGIGAPRGAAPVTATETNAAPEPPKKGAHGAGHGWAYTGANGPENWGNLSPEAAVCGAGKQQSPIDIGNLAAVELADIQFDWQPGPLKVVNNGHTIQFNVTPGSQMRVGPRTFRLLQTHFHAPSEHTLFGRRFDMEAHFVHVDEWGQLGVVGVMMQRGERNPALQQLWDFLPNEVGVEQAAGKGSLENLLPNGRRYYRYAGSLTTPPCSEGVSWFVLREPVTVSDDQLQAFTRRVTANARPVQPVGSRQVLSTR